MSTNDDLRGRFVQDTRKRLKTIRDAAGDLGADAAIEGSLELVRSQAHMIRGAAGMLDFNEVKAAAGKLESAASEKLEAGGELADETLSVALEQLADVIDAL